MSGSRWMVVVLCAVLGPASLAAAFDLDLPEEPAPKTWADVPLRYQSECPSPLFTLATPEKVSVAGHTFEIQGSTMVRQGGRWTGPLRIGVLGAVKEASKETRANIKKAVRIFKDAKVDLVVSNGDISEGEFDLEDAFMMLAEEVPMPLMVHIGNSEGKGSFTRAYSRVKKQHPQMFNMNWIRHVDWGGIHLVSLPGYFNMRFLHGRAGCHYKKEHLRELEKLVRALPKGDVVIMTAHGPPHSFGKQAIDVAVEAGNVGDPDLTAVLEDAPVPFGIFGHILEAGGRATADLKRGTPLALPVKTPQERLYINAGSVSATPWAMLKGPPSYGMAAVMTVQDGKATVVFHTLRKGR